MPIFDECQVSDWIVQSGYPVQVWYAPDGSVFCWAVPDLPGCHDYHTSPDVSITDAIDSRITAWLATHDIVPTTFTDHVVAKENK